jgi:hypothetical protein
LIENRPLLGIKDRDEEARCEAGLGLAKPEGLELRVAAWTMDGAIASGPDDLEGDARAFGELGEVVRQ